MLNSLAERCEMIPIRNKRNGSGSPRKSFRLLRCAVAASWFAASLVAQKSDGVALRARAVLGLEGVGHSSSGQLSIQEDALVYSRSEGPAVRMPLSAIQGAFLSQQDKQVGGLPMALGRAATPYGGGRAIGLFAHKKYDFVTLEYSDSNGGLHGAIYQLKKGQGQTLIEQLGGKGVRVRGLELATGKQRTETDNAK